MTTQITITDSALSTPLTLLLQPTPKAPTIVALGAWTPPIAPNWDQWDAAHYASTVGTPPALVHYYQDLRNESYNNFNSSLNTEIVSTGALPLISWELCDSTVSPEQNQPLYNNMHFSAGVYDRQMIAWLDAANAWGKPFLLRPFWEMTGMWYPWAANCNGNTPGSFIDAWRHVYRLIKAHAPLARVVWCPEVGLPGLLSPEDCYPGDAYVDYLGLDGYNCSTQAGGWTHGWVSFAQVFHPSVARLAALAPRKRVVICETGCVSLPGPLPGQTKPQWIAGIPDALAAMPSVAAVCWWNNTSAALDFHFDDGGSALATYRVLARTPSMRGAL